MTGAQSSERVTLAPCPWCHDTWVKVFQAPAGWTVLCGSCWATGPGRKLKAEAIAAWNRRAALSTPATTGEGERLRRALSLALKWLIQYEPGDSRAVSDEFVAMAAIEAGLGDASCDAIISAALERTDLAALPPSSGWEAGANVLEVLQDAEEALIAADLRSDSHMARLLPIIQDCIIRAIAAREARNGFVASRSDWAAGAEVMRALETIVGMKDVGMGYLMRREAQRAIDAIRALPLPPPPSSEGA